jgi:hypothetical protein
VIVLGPSALVDAVLDWRCMTIPAAYCNSGSDRVVQRLW